MFQFDKRRIGVLGVMGLIIIGLIAFIAFKDRVDFRDKPHGLELVDEETLNPMGNSDNAIDEDATRRRTENEQGNIKIYITGQVRNPGVIEVAPDCRLNDAIDMVGGFLPDADLLKVNLATRVQDEGMYIIPKIGEEIPEASDSIIGPQGGDAKVNINTADKAQLETLPRIGPVTAQKIMDYREQNGHFKREEDIMNVSGIGEKTYEGLKDLIGVR